MYIYIYLWYILLYIHLETCKDEEYLDIKIGLCKKCLFGELVLACEDEILNTTVISKNITAWFMQFYW